MEEHARKLLLLLATVVAASPRLEAQTVDWRLLPPSHWSGSRMVFDSSRSRFVLHCASTLEWDGGAWQYRATAQTPPVRTDFGFAFDDLRRRAVLFGGVANSQPLADTWEYDGLDWIRRTPANSPAARQGMAMAFDLLRGRTVMHGSHNGASDTWTWDGSNWQQVAGTGPAALYSPSMAFHLASGKLVLFGAYYNLAPETWTFDGTTWQQETPATVPPARYAHQLSGDPGNGVVHMYGGGESTMWDWNGTDWSPGSVGPDGRQDHAMASDFAGNTMVFGGRRLLPLPGVPLVVQRDHGDTWQVQGSTWSLLAEGGPRLGTETLIAHDLVRSRLVILSTPNDQAEPAPVLEWDGDRWFSVRAQPQPLPLALTPAVCFDAARNRTLRFGGMYVRGFNVATFNDLYEWDGANWTQRSSTTPPPAPRWRHAMTFDYARGVVVMFGGLAAATGVGVGTPVNDTWEWNGTAWNQVATSGPSARAGHGMAYDIARGRTVLFGGTVGTQVLNDTWEWDGASWTRRLPAHAPPGRTQFACAYDIARGRVQVCGGLAQTTQLDHWEWDGSDWLQRASTLPFVAGQVEATGFLGDRAVHVNDRFAWVGTVPSAHAASAGAPCGSSVTPQLRPLGVPHLDNPWFAVDLHRGTAFAPVLFAVGLGRTAVPLGSGCTLYLPNLDLTFLASTNSNGAASVALSVPAAPALLALEGGVQAAQLDPLAPLGVALTDTVEWRIGL